MLLDVGHNTHSGEMRTHIARTCTPRRAKQVGILSLVLGFMLFLAVVQKVDRALLPSLKEYHTVPVQGHAKIKAGASRNDLNLHLIIPASNQDVNLCKLLLGCSLLGYPNPTLVAWNDTFDRPGILGGGSHLAKVSKALDYLRTLPSSQDDDLVLMLDAYDIHIQLPKSTLIDRYFEIRHLAQQRLISSLGEPAVQDFHLNQTVIFGAGKRCAPNQPHTIACYPIPESPAPTDLYGSNTDTVIGHNHHYSVRQRYLNSGYVLGTAGAVRKIFTEAYRRIEAHPDRDPLDDGSHGSDFMYHGSDQSIFAAMYGRQEYAREKIRLRYALPGTEPRSSAVFFSKIDNVLNPSFHHEEFDVDLDNEVETEKYEYGMFLDFFSDLGHQTINSEEDAKWLTYAEGGDKDRKSIEEQIGPRTEGFDCPSRPPKSLPKDILESRLATDAEMHAEGEWHSESLDSALSDSAVSPWLSRPLYTHLCLSRIPVLRHMNGIKEHREQHWNRVWYQPQARQMLNELRKGLEIQRSGYEHKPSFHNHIVKPRLYSAGGAWTGEGDLLPWENICPIEYEREIFRDADQAG